MWVINSSWGLEVDCSVVHMVLSTFEDPKSDLFQDSKKDVFDLNQKALIAYNTCLSKMYCTNPTPRRAV